MAVNYRTLCQQLLPLADTAAHNANPETAALLVQARQALAQPPQRTPLKWLPLPTLTRHALQRAGYESIEELLSASDEQLSRARQVGPHGLRLIRAALEQWRGALC